MDTKDYKAKVTAAFDQAAATYDRLGVDFFTPMGRRLAEHAELAAGHEVLDVGCGRGACLFPAAVAVGPQGRVLGIDIAPSMVEEAAAEAGRLGLGNVEVRTMDGEEPDLPGRSFDRITGSYSVIFFPDAPAALARYATMLRPGGRLAFTSPVFLAGTFPFLPPIFSDLIPTSLLAHLPPDWQPAQLQSRFNSWLEHPSDLERTMLAAGFSEVQILDETVPMVADSGADWVDWSHTQGMRLLWQHLPPEAAAALRQRLTTALDALRVDGGRLTIDVPVRYVVATVAGSRPA